MWGQPTLASIIRNSSHTQRQLYSQKRVAAPRCFILDDRDRRPAQNLITRTYERIVVTGNQQ